MAKVAAEQDAVATLVGANRRELSRLLGALQLFGRDPPPALLVNPADAEDAVRGAILIRAIAPELENRAQQLSLEARGLTSLRREVAAAEGELFAAESALEDRAGRLEGVASDADSLIPPGARERGTAALRGPPPSRLLYPAKGEIVSGFGGSLAGGGRSRGLAIRTAPSATVESPAPGLVDYAGPLQGWGQVVILGAAGGYHMVFSGLGRVLVVPGQRLATGETLGVMPGAPIIRPQLYFELRRGGAPIDPSPLMTGDLARAPLLRRKLL
ncbi:MAG TPA: peptidoglycan DD-metalloendopeptidase family protein [Caulobacteraceae bacterium]